MSVHTQNESHEAREEFIQEKGTREAVGLERKKNCRNFYLNLISFILLMKGQIFFPLIRVSTFPRAVFNQKSSEAVKK